MYDSLTAILESKIAKNIVMPSLFLISKMLRILPSLLAI